MERVYCREGSLTVSVRVRKAGRPGIIMGYMFDQFQIKCLIQVIRNSDGISQKVIAGCPCYKLRYHVVIVISLCMCVVPLYGFLAGLQLMFATCAGKGK